MAKPFAVFDIDGTLIRWQLYHAVADQLARDGFIEPKVYAGIQEARLTWKRRNHEESFKDYERQLVTVYDQALKNLKVEDFEHAIKVVFEEYKDQVYTYTRDLLRGLKDKGYLLFALSGSQVEIVGLLADYYGFDASAGSTHARSKGRFTGESDVMRSDRKVEALHKLVKKFDASWDGSLAVGDSISDVPMMAAVENPIAFNPERALLDHAMAKNWPVVLERKNVIYKLEPGNGQYILAKAD